MCSGNVGQDMMKLGSKRHNDDKEIVFGSLEPSQNDSLQQAKVIELASALLVGEASGY